MRISPQISSVAIIALGNFNPLIFRPDWFRDKEIVIGSDFDGVQVDIIHSEICGFRLPWGQMQVDRDRFSITALREPIVKAQDFFVKTFQSLPETPIRALGINRDVHFSAGSRAALDYVGDVLAPKEFWGEFLGKDGVRYGGLRTLIIEQAQPQQGRLKRLDGLFGYVRVQLEPSIRDVPHGIYVLVNNHFDLLKDGDRPVDGRRAAALADEKWSSCLIMSEALFDQIMELANAKRSTTE